MQVGAETFRLCRQLVDGVLLVDNAAISAAIKDVFNETRSILEPAGAVAVAGAKAWLKENEHKVGAEGLVTRALCSRCTPVGRGWPLLPVYLGTPPSSVHYMDMLLMHMCLEPTC